MNNLSTDELFEFYKRASRALCLAKATYETCDYEIPFPEDLQSRFGKASEGLSEIRRASKETVELLIDINETQKQRAALQEKAKEELQISEKIFLDDSESQIAFLEKRTNKAQMLFAKAKTSPLDRDEKEELFSILKSTNPALGKHLSFRIEHHFEDLKNLEKELNLAINSYKQETSQ